MRSHVTLAAVLILGLAQAAPAQSPADRERARIHERLGWENMKAEAWDAAAKSFSQAVEIDPDFDFAYYGLGRAQMAQRKYSDAITTLTKCRDLYRAQAGRQFSNAQEAQRYRNNRLIEIDDQIRQVQSGPQTASRQDMLRQLQNYRRDLQNEIQRGTNMTIGGSVPAYVSLSLGSAYFRAGQLAEAEREYKAAIEADSKSGEAMQNLAVVYMETGRFAEAAASIAAAKKTGFRVNPALEEDIKSRRKSGS